ncbi:RNA polymerase II mediator complex subunit MED27 domain-containing protein [Aspergillus alliaceus]|uniref:RNA polymerase II mediator complex subunit MED27 domain-containing protein n=1 Tax=Petromyces alliaceus TaxID=209559 RepID=UPI0012A54D93|nr:mediator complex subunit 27-domain-containing protein [Aspergillus alliaceus]KAB8237246.1 mediator complex subunit 27-domain-containing protein [Aspergillus alliaceus]
MASASQAAPKFPTVSVVVPKMEFPSKQGLPKVSQTKTNNEATNKTNAIKSESDNINVNATSSPAPTMQTNASKQVSESEMQLVSSLAKLQKLETMIHQLRTLLPDRLLDPLVPIVNPKAAAGRSIPRSPQVLYEQLSQAAKSGVAEVTEFQNMWRSPEVKAVWERVDAQIRENGGQLLQPTGVWDRNYGKLLEGLLKEETARTELQRNSEEELERSKIQSTEGGWRAIVDGFIQKNVPGVRTLPSKSEAAVTVVLPKAGMSFKVHTVAGSEVNGVPAWQVSSRTMPRQATTKLESAVSDCLNSRPRQWDLAYLLDMISSYSNIKQTTCAKCGKMTDNAAQLPAIRQQKQSSEPQLSPIWEAYHPSCV